MINIFITMFYNLCVFRLIICNNKVLQNMVAIQFNIGDETHKNVNRCAFGLGIKRRNNQQKKNNNSIWRQKRTIILIYGIILWCIDVILVAFCFFLFFIIILAKNKRLNCYSIRNDWSKLLRATTKIQHIINLKRNLNN